MIDYIGIERFHKRGGIYEQQENSESLAAVYIYIGSGKKSKGEYHHITEFW